MGARIDPDALREVTAMGGGTFDQCFNCGNCTAVCTLIEADSDMVFPRKLIRYMQLGLTDELERSVGPWLCYYCGDCSRTCPREAVPGELMASARRWLAARYDWTSITRWMVRSNLAQGLAAILAAVVMAALFLIPDNFGFGLLARHPEAMQTVQLQYFAPKAVVHHADLIVAFSIFFLLVTFVLRMMVKVMRGQGVPWWRFVTGFYRFMVDGITQKRWRKCEAEVRVHWWRHWFLVTGYCAMFLLVVAFLDVFQVEDTSIHWTAYIGYYATVVLLLGTGWMLLDRIRKRKESHKHSQLTDWMFPVLLFLVVLSGIVVHIFRVLDMPMATYVAYMIHMMLDAPLFLVVVPFGKWPHLLYRPMAAYLEGVRHAAERRAHGAVPDAVRA